MLPRHLKNVTHALAWVAPLVAVLTAACGERAATDDVSAPPAAAVELPPAAELPPIALREGDGLPETLPSDLTWETNDEDPTFASPEAKRGGVFRDYILAFPLTLRTVGPDSNGAFAGFLRYNRMTPVAYHPNTRRPIPALATHWAFGADGRSLYYKLNPAARWSDGVPVTAADFVFSVQMHRSKEVKAPWYNNYYTDRIRDVKAYGDHVIGVQGADPKPRQEMHYQYALPPQPRHFHVLTNTWVQDYNWRIEPNTGPYQIGKVSKGKYIELHRKNDWWGNDLKYYRHRFNPDKVRVRVIRDTNIAYQHFLKGKLDTFSLVTPSYWHEKATGAEFDNGYIWKYWFYRDLPVPSAGMFLNTSDALLADRQVRLGLARSMNFDRVLNNVLRGDFFRLPTFQLGFGGYDNRDIKARTFDLEAADKHFKAAGFTTRGEDGVRIRDGQRLSFRVTYGYPNQTERLVVLQEDAKKAGVELELQLLDSSNSFKLMSDKKHQIAWMTWGTSGLSPRYWEHFHSVNANKLDNNNITNHANPEMDKLIMAYRASADLAERQELAKRLERMVHDSGVVIPTFQIPYTRAGAWRWVKLPPWLGARTTSWLFNSQALAAGIFSSGGLFWLDEEEKRNTLEAKKAGRVFEPVTLINEDFRAG